MNVIVNAHQKDKYGSNQAIIGITSDSEKNDEYFFDFVFRLITRGNEFKAITEKQRVLPIELDPESHQFPKEFFWSYNNLLQFYNKEYLECESLKTANTFPNNEKQKEIKSEIENKKEPIKQNNNSDLSDIDKIKLLLKENDISTKSFKIFLREVGKMEYVKKLNTLKESDQKLILKKWNKIKEKYLNFTFPEDKKITTEQATGISEKEEQKTLNKFEPSKPISEEQKEILIRKLEESHVPVSAFFNGFSLKRWEEINQEGANNMIKNFEIMLNGIEE